MLSFPKIWFGACAAALCGLMFVGCGESEPVAVAIPQTYNNMKTLGAAYIQATQKNNRPPQKLEDLRPFVHPSINLEQIAHSENDNQDFVIVWGVDFRTAGQQGGMPIVIYERTGLNGERYVCQFNDVQIFNEEQFKAAKFPDGHTPSL